MRESFLFIKDVDICVVDELRIVKDMLWFSLGLVRIFCKISENYWGIYTLCQLYYSIAWLS